MLEGAMTTWLIVGGVVVAAIVVVVLLSRYALQGAIRDMFNLFGW